MKARQAGWVIPVDVSKIPSHQPCESCGYRRTYYKATIDPPGRARVTMRLCTECIKAIDLRP